MQEIATRLEELCDRMKAVENVVQKLVSQTMTKEERNALRRQYYRQQREAEMKDRLILPDRHVLTYKDERLRKFYGTWAEAGMKFGAADKPEAFIIWIVHEWNCCTYLKKPITFSGSSFRVWVGHVRHPMGAGDLMHYYQKRSGCPMLRNEGEYQDFQNRPWWDWGYNVLYPVFCIMQELGFDKLPERFQRCVRILVGGFGELKPCSDIEPWDPNAGRANINKMLKRVGVDYVSMLRSSFIGLKASPCPAKIPA
mgnify:FL=1